MYTEFVWLQYEQCIFILSPLESGCVKKARQPMKHHRIACLALLVALVAGVWSLFPQGFQLEGFLSRHGRAAPLIFIGCYIVSTVGALPGSLLTAAGGALFGAAAGALWSLVGATLGAVVSFLVSRHVFSDWFRHRAGTRATRVIAGVDRSGWRFVALVRLVPLFPFNAVNYLLGLTRVRLVPYTLATFVCMAPGALACALLGQGGLEAARGDGGCATTLAFALGLFAGAALLPGAIGRFCSSWRGVPNPPTVRSRRTEANVA
jgi:uncharacterized membrane protein YdjX (TVP38/TMEM64 family)